MASGVNSDDGDIGFQIAPMVDVVFVLLLFFMASAGSQVVERELNVSPPSGQPDLNNVVIIPIVISINEKGAVAVNDSFYDNTKSKDMPELRNYLKGIMNKFDHRDPVIIRPSPDTRQERIIDVLNAAAASGVTKLAFG
ncbi:MAG: biopolymer transporter ExbD [Chthoniobacterales bacterium]